MDPLTTWNTGTFIQSVAEAVKIAQPQHVEAVTPGSPLASKVTDFCLFLTAAATIGGVTSGGESVSLALPAGYNPIRFKSIASVSTGTAYALW